jgi:hypothetical protein
MIVLTISTIFMRHNRSILKPTKIREKKTGRGMGGIIGGKWGYNRGPWLRTKAVAWFCVVWASFQLAQDPFLKDSALKWFLHFKRESLKRESFCCDIVLYPTYPTKASLLCGGWLLGDMWDIGRCRNKRTLFWKTLFWNVGAISKHGLSKRGPAHVGFVSVALEDAE